MPWFGFGRRRRRQKRRGQCRSFLKGSGTLAEMNIGQKARVVRISGSGQIRHRLIDLGFHNGETVEVIRTAPLRDPIEIAINGGRISIRRSEAALVNVELIPAYK
ncbi:MAG TPA: ferrous iron transport protein A [candidate division Zixibacteria bacterium]|nr:ferrous iron transport protein A [candidate division Zixibacteria bacterium]